MTYRDDLRTWRPVVMGRRGAVATNHTMATEAAYWVLRRGGNAMDAYVAAGVALGVVEPYMSGVGGDGFAFVYTASDGQAVVVNGTGPAPRSATPEAYADGIPEYGPRSCSVPGSVDKWLTVHARYGSMPLRDLFEPAIYHARDGFGVTQRCRFYIDKSADLLARDPTAKAAFLPKGRVPAVGETIRQPALARTLEAIADGGREIFYQGEIARQIAAWSKRVGAHIAYEDLAEYHCELQSPIRTTYRGLEVLEAPPNSVGFVLLQELNIAEQFDLAKMGYLSADLVHTMVEIKKLAFADRERYAGDPRFVDVPLDRLLSKEYAAELADRVRRSPRAAAAPAAVAAGDTTYFCIADGAGNVVSGIQSINSMFGSHVMAGDTGILMNNRMPPWHLEAGHPNRLMPDKRVRHTMNPPLALKDGQPYLVWGTPGGDNQVQINFQVLVGIVDLGLDPQQALEMPRWSDAKPGQLANYPHQQPDELTMEDRFPADVRNELASRGHNVVKVGPLAGPCSGEAILRHPESGLYLAASDPRRDGWAMAF